MPSPTSLNDIWGKDPQRLLTNDRPYPLIAHLLDTYMTSQAIWDTWLTERLRRQITEALAPGAPERAKQLVGLAAALHDVGKANPIFQLQAADSRKLGWRPILSKILSDIGLEEVDRIVAARSMDSKHIAGRRHEYIGYLALNGGNIVDPDEEDVHEKWLPTVVAGHHGHWHLPTSVADLCAEMCVCGNWGDTQAGIIDRIHQALGFESRDVPDLDPELAQTTVVLVSGLVILADWLASNEIVVGTGYSLIANGSDPQDTQMWIDSRRQELLQFVTETIGSYSTPADSQQSVLGEYDPRPLQKDAIENSETGGLWIVAYPTGEGKTEAALLRHMGFDDEGLLFGLPTRATTDAMQVRLAEIFKGTGNEVILSHQFARSGTDWFTNGLRRLIAPVSTATCDQILMGSLSQKHIALRLLALANHHVILDEVHTYDHYQVVLVKELLAWWGATRTRVTLLSATLPAWQQHDFEQAYRTGLERAVSSTTTVEPTYPSHRFVNQDAEPVFSPSLSNVTPSINVDLIASRDKTESHVEWVTRTHQQHPSCHIAVVVNTVDTCIETAKRVAKALPNADVICLHSRMVQKHRKQIETDLQQRLGKEAKNARPIVVVATSVIEASLDLDFDFMSTDLAPAASLIQRAGRLWRFHDSSGRDKRLGYAAPFRKLHVVAGVNQEKKITPPTALPYMANELQRVFDWLAKNSAIRVPEDIQGFVDDTAFSIEDFWAPITASPDYVVTAADMEEIQSLSRRQDAAKHSAAQLITNIVTTQDPTYRQLHKISKKDDSEERMMTRFIDMPGGTFVLIETRSGLSQPYAYSSSVKDLSGLTSSKLIGVLDFIVPAGGKADRKLREIHAETLKRAGIEQWEPESRMLAGILPIAWDLLEGHPEYRYDNLTGISVAVVAPRDPTVERIGEI